MFRSHPPRSSQAFRPAVLCLLLALATGAAANSPAPLQAPDDLQLQRSQFAAAEEALDDRRFATFRQIVAKLEDYPLLPYLEYRELRRRLYLFPYAEVDGFLQQYQDTYIGDLMTREWLETLAQQGHWSDYRKYFPRADLDSDELTCFFLRARLKTGDDSALAEVTGLWNVGRSQPKACDPLFRVWMDRGYLTDDIAWERHSKAIAQGNISLARYVARKMSPQLKPLADLYDEVDRHPERLRQEQRFSSQTARMHEIILHGFRRYARRDPLEALELWEHYDAAHYFPAEDRDRTQEYLITHLTVEGQMAAAQRLLKQMEKISSSELIAWLVRDALRDQDWQRAYDSIQLFPAEEEESERWLYWRARALEHLDRSDPEYGTAQQIYSRLALTRNFYGFLAADILGRDYTLVDRPANPPAQALDSVRNLPGMRRARELLNLNRVVEARREWFYATRGFEAPDLLAAAKLAERWGWYRKSIQSMIEARYWDDLELRFPLAYRDAVNDASASTDIEPTLLFAIARQESAFAADARSPAGAMGLMQLMPSTARRTARSIGVKYRYWDLIDPMQNLRLGSRYLHQLLNQFNGNHILAAAAYNAGPERVKEWLSDKDQGLPYDIWIETIPYRETRGYVQNVLAFSVIYGYRLGKQITLLPERKHPGITFLNIGGK